MSRASRSRSWSDWRGFGRGWREFNAVSDGSSRTRQLDHLAVGVDGRISEDPVEVDRGVGLPAYPGVVADSDVNGAARLLVEKDGADELADADVGADPEFREGVRGVALVDGSVAASERSADAGVESVGMAANG